MIIETLKSNCIYCKRVLHDSKEQYHIECYKEVIAYRNRPVSIIEWLYNNGFTGTENELLNLESLNLYNYQLSSLPPEIDQLQQLKTLGICYNKLTSLPEEITQLKQLVYLDLSYNKFTSLPVEIYQLKKLKELCLSFNRLTSLPAEISQLKRLDFLNLSCNQFPQVEIDRIRELLPKSITAI